MNCTVNRWDLRITNTIKYNYLKCWFTDNWTIGNKLLWKFNQITKLFIEKDIDIIRYRLQNGLFVSALMCEVLAIWITTPIAIPLVDGEINMK